MWRKLGTDGPQNFKQSAEWRDAEERVNRARKKKESRDDKRWVVWFAILFPDMDILDNVNPRKFRRPVVDYSPLKNVGLDKPLTDHDGFG